VRRTRSAGLCYADRLSAFSSPSQLVSGFQLVKIWPQLAGISVFRRLVFDVIGRGSNNDLPGPRPQEVFAWHTCECLDQGL
jgi:hypothetical protein